MKILIAPDKFKGSLSAQEVCESLKAGLLDSSKGLEIIMHPMADGGDGSLAILNEHFTLNKHTVQTVDPLGRPISADYYSSEDTAFIELASASGLILLDQYERNPLVTSTRGTGILMKDAIQKGFEKIWLFLGGSATNDAGIGIAQALGFNFLDAYGEQLDPSGHNLLNISEIQTSSDIDFNKIKITLLSDVKNPMHGEDGAAYVYGAQKGAENWAIKKLDEGLKNYDNILKSKFQKDISHLPGMGSAGAIGASLVGLCNARIKSGFDMIANITGLGEALDDADLVISGEGKLDRQSLQGKVVGEIRLLCEEKNKRLILAVGRNDLADSMNQFDHIFTIEDRATDQKDAMTNGARYLTEIGKIIQQRTWLK